MKYFSPFTALCTVGFFAKFSYALARSPVLPLFALYLGGRFRGHRLCRRYFDGHRDLF